MKDFNEFINEGISTDEMMEVFNEFGIDIHSLSTTDQYSMNMLVKEIIKLRKKLSKK